MYILKTKLALVAFLGAASLLFPMRAASQNDGLDFYARSLKYAIGKANERIYPILDPSDRYTLENIQVVIPSTWEFIAEAYGDRIAISAGATTVYDLIISTIISEDMGFHGCGEEYLGYLGRSIEQNSARVRAGQSPRIVGGPDYYGRTYGGACSGYDRMAWTEEHRRFYSVSMGASTLYLYLHELAHHVLGHVGVRPRDLRNSRADEAAADAWAIRVGVEAGFDMAFALPAFLFGVTFAGPLEAEIESTHPHDVRRLHDNLSLIIKVLREEGQEEAASYVEQAFFDLLREVSPLIE